MFEFKVVRESEGEEAKLQEGAEQMMSKRYGQQERSSQLKRVVLVYSIKSRQFVKWREIED